MNDEFEHELDKETGKRFTRQANRSLRQSNELYSLLNGSLKGLIELELKIKNCFLHWCPSTVEEIESVMKMEPKSTWFKFEYERDYPKWEEYEPVLRKSEAIYAKLFKEPTAESEIADKHNKLAMIANEFIEEKYKLK